MIILAVYVLLALVVSFTCSILEAVLLSVTPSYAALLEEQRHPLAARLRSYKENIDRPLAAILSLNTIAHTVGAAGAGAQAAKVFGSGSVGVFSAVLTLLILVATEIIPKTMGAVHWKRLVPLVLRVLPLLTFLMWPLVRLAQWLRRLLSPKEPEATVSREEIAALADEGTRTGVMHEQESRVLRNLLRLSRVRVRDVMTPRDEVVLLDEQMRIGTAMHQALEMRYSRIPLFVDTGSGLRCTGYALKDDILTDAARDEHPRLLSELRRDICSVTAGTPVPEVFELMVERREHIAVVLDGDEMAGIVTMEDLVETLLGLEIMDELDDEETIQKLAREHWRKRSQRRQRRPAA